MKELLACRGGISGEHLISESVIRLIAGNGGFTIGGTPWLAEGELRAVGPNSLTAKCLCERHNSDLHPLDDAALFFFRSLKDALEGSDEPINRIISGHDIERWLLKSLKAMAASGNLAAGRQKLVGDFATDIRILDMLEDIKAWPQSAGLYCLMKGGDLTYNHNRFQIAPLTNAAEEICGLWTDIMGISFVLLLERLHMPNIPQLAQATFRPGGIDIQYPRETHQIMLSWTDGSRHRDKMTLGLVRDVQTSDKTAGSGS